MTVKSLVAVGAFVLVLQGCADKRGGPIPYEVSDFGTPDSINTAI